MRAHTPVGHGNTPDTESNTQLERAGDETSVSRRRGLSLENGNKTRGSTDTETGEKTSNTNLTIGVNSRSLKLCRSLSAD